MSIYRGTKFGFIQSKVYDQMGIALEGCLANASDINLCDAISVGETNGIGVGLGVTIKSLAGAKKAGINDQKIMLPAGEEANTDFGGIVVRTESGHTDASGRNYMANEEMASVLRATRVGGRIFVKAQKALTAGGSLYWIIANATSHGLEIGGFSGSAITGSVGGSQKTDTVDISAKAKVLNSAAAGELALIEILG